MSKRTYNFCSFFMSKPFLWSSILLYCQYNNSQSVLLVQNSNDNQWSVPRFATRKWIDLCEIVARHLKIDKSEFELMRVRYTHDQRTIVVRVGNNLIVKNIKPKLYKWFQIDSDGSFLNPAKIHNGVPRLIQLITTLPQPVEYNRILLNHRHNYYLIE